MRYAISNRQLKELANGKLLRIALPVPTDDQTDLVAWAGASLEVAPEYVRAAAEDEVCCVAHPNSDHEVERQVGRILRDQDSPLPGAILYYVAVVIVELSARDQPRGKYPPQWPGKIVEED